MRHISADTVSRVLTPRAAHNEVRRVLSLWGSDGIAVPPRVRATARGQELNILGGVVADDFGGVWSGVKIYNVISGVGSGHKVLLLSPTGESFGLDAQELGALRTGAVSGVATEALHGNAQSLAMIGAGYQAPYQLRALAETNPGVPIRLWARDVKKARVLAHQMRDLHGIDVQTVNDLEQATVGADVITILTRASQPVLDVSHVQPGAHVNAAGSNSLQRQEVTAALVEASRVVVDSIDQAKLESGDLLPSLESGRISWASIEELGNIVAHGKRWDSGDRTLFESQGIGALDVALAVYVARQLETGEYKS